MIREHFLPLPVIGLAEGVKLYRAVQDLPDRVTLESPALEVMTDLKQLHAQTMEPEASVETANAKMIRKGVRSLLVTDPQEKILGLITATDILGEHLVQAMHARGVSRQEVLVREIMTPRDRLEALDIVEVRAAKVGHIVSTLKQAGRHHSIVVEVHQLTFQERLSVLGHTTSTQTVCGLFSTTQIARQLGLHLHDAELATTFAEVEALIAH